MTGLGFGHEDMVAESPVPSITGATKTALVLLGVATLVALWTARSACNACNSDDGMFILWLAAPYAALAALALCFRTDAAASMAVLIGTLLTAGPMTLLLVSAAQSATSDGQAAMGIGIVLTFASLGGWVVVAIVGLVGWRAAVGQRVEGDAQPPPASNREPPESGSFAPATPRGELKAEGRSFAPVGVVLGGSLLFLTLTVAASGVGGFLLELLFPGLHVPGQGVQETVRNDRPDDDAAKATARAWLSAGDLLLTDPSNAQFRKRANWQAFRGVESFGVLLNRDSSYEVRVEGMFAPEAEPTAVRTYSGPARFIFHRKDDGGWVLTTVELRNVLVGSRDSLNLGPGPWLTSNVAIDVEQRMVESAAAPDSRETVRAVPPPLSTGRVKAALETWLALTLPLGDGLMKDPGGTVEVTSVAQYQTPAGVSDTVATAKVTFNSVPYHGAGAPTARREYSGPGEASFSVADDGHLLLSSAYLLNIKVGLRAPGYWRPDRPADGIRVPD